MDYLTIKQWCADNVFLLPVFLVITVVSFLLLRLQNSLRERSATEIEKLLATDPARCAERLENNKLFRTVFRKPVIELWKLQAYMLLGQDDRIEATLDALVKMRLEPRDKLEYYQQSLSYYAVIGKYDEAVKVCDDLHRFIIKAKAQYIEPYASILDEADTIVGVYVEHNTALIKKLIGKAEHTKNNISRGITQFRIAKLAYYKGDKQLLDTYLNRSEENLKGTAYEEIIEQAKIEPSILK